MPFNTPPQAPNDPERIAPGSTGDIEKGNQVTSINGMRIVTSSNAPVTADNTKGNWHNGDLWSDTSTNPGTTWQYQSGAWVKLSATPIGTAGGSLTGTYPNPSIASGAVSTTMIAANAITNVVAANGSSSDISTSSGSYTDADGTNLAITITTTGGDVYVFVSALIENNTVAPAPVGAIYLGVKQDSAAAVTISGGGWNTAVDPGGNYAFSGNGSSCMRFAAPSAGSHTYKLQFKTNGSGVAHIRGDLGTTQMWALEIKR